MELNKVYHGDCVDVMKTFSNESIDLIVTDPPYGVNFNKSKHYNDTKEHVSEKLNIWLSEMYRVLKESSHVYIFIPTIEVDMWVSAVKNKFNFKNLIATQMYITNRYNNDNFGWDLQLIIYASKGKAKRFNAVDWIPASQAWINDKRNLTPKKFTYKYPSFISNSIARANMKNGNSRKRIHPNEKNEELIANLVKMSSKEGDVVLDCFSGSGSTLLAAKKTDRKYIGIEQNEEFVKTINQRIHSFLL